MKKNLLYSLLAGACLASVASCDVNAWNDKLDGFEGDPAATNKQAVEYTLTAADYANLAANSDNIAKAGDALSKQLKAVGTQHYFTNEISAKEYIPNFLSDPDFSYFTLSDGSSIKITYNTAAEMPEDVVAFGSATEYTLIGEDYILAWDDDIEYAEAFTPSVTAKATLPALLAYRFPDAEKGDMIVVNYNQAYEEPDFGGSGSGSGGGDEPQPTFQKTSVLGTVAVDDVVEVAGVVSAICNRGFILTDNSGSILVYYSSGFTAADWTVGTQVKVSGTVSAFGTGLQISGTAEDYTVSIEGTEKVAYPAAKVLTGADFDAAAVREGNFSPQYCQFTATAAVSNFINFNVEGAEASQGSIYQGTSEQKALFADGVSYTITGYLVSISSKKYVNFVLVDAKSVAAAPALKDAPTFVPYEKVTAVYAFDGNKWSANTSIDMVQPSDYEDMDQKYYNLSDPDFYLPIYLKEKYPFAREEDSKLVGYKLYKSGATSFVCDEYAFDGTQWIKNTGVIEESAQFVRTGGKWMYNPNVEITLPAGKGIEISTLYYQACVDWVYENIDKPLGSTGIKDGNFYVSSYGNNEYYCGTSAYQGNVDLRPAKAREQYPAGYEGMDDDAILALMKKRFTTEVMPGALAAIHPDAAPIDGLDVIYTINFGVYTGSNATYTARFKVVAPGKFEFVDCTWDAAE